MSSYSNYLGSKKCCVNNLSKTITGPQGHQGSAGPIGPFGNQGATGSQGFQGATGLCCRGPPGVTGAQGPAGGAQGSTGVQGFQGATGGSPWIPMNGTGLTGSGYTGTGYTGDVLIYGNLLVTGAIDPTYISFTPQLSTPIPPGQYGTWIDSVNGNALRTDKIYLDDTTGFNTSYVSINPLNNSQQVGLADGIGNINNLTYNSMIITSSTSETITYGLNNIQFNNLSVAPYINIGGSNQLLINGNGANAEINTNGQNLSMGDTQTNQNGTTILINDAHFLVNTNAVMMTAYNNSYILPICYTYKYSGAFSYGSPGWSPVRQDNINGLPSEFYSVNNTFWNYKIEYSINMFNNNNTGDKGTALYIEIRDSLGNSYLPFLYNLTTPFTRYSNQSTYNNTSTNMLTFTWTDYINLNGIAGNSPLEWRLWWYADNNTTSDFNMVISLTRINLV